MIRNARKREEKTMNEEVAVDKYVLLKCTKH